MNNKNIENSALAFILLNSRRVNYAFRAQHGLNKGDLELITYALRYGIFNAYQAANFFKHMNVQQLRRTIKKLVEASLLEIIRVGTKYKPELYVLTEKGEDVLMKYFQSWNSI